MGKNLRYFTLDRWNWSQKAEKWVYVKILDGKRHYTYQIDPPNEFLNLSRELNEINEELMVTTDLEENEKLFKKIMVISKKMQEMGKEEE